MSFRNNQRYNRTDNQRLNQYQPSQARFVSGPQTFPQQQQLGNVRFTGNSTIPSPVVTSRVQTAQPQNVFNTLQPPTAASGAAPWGSGMVVQQGQQPGLQPAQMQPATFQNPAMQNMSNMQSMQNMQNMQNMQSMQNMANPQNQANMMGLITNPQILAQAAGLVATPGLGIQVPFAGPGILGPGPIRGQLSQVYQSVGQTGLGTAYTPPTSNQRNSRSTNKESRDAKNKDKRSFDRSRSRSRDRRGRDKDNKDGRRDKGDKNVDRRESRKVEVDNRRDNRNVGKTDRRDDKKDDRNRIENKNFQRNDKSNDRKDNKKDNRRDVKEERRDDRGGDKKKSFDTARRGQRADNYDSDSTRRGQRTDNYDSDSARRGQRADNYDSDSVARRGQKGDNYDSDSVARRGQRADNRDIRNRPDTDRSKDKGRKTNQGNRSYRDGDQSDVTSPEQKRFKKGKDNVKSSRKSRGDNKDSGAEEMYDDILEEEIPAWLRCSPSDLYFNRDNQMFKDTTLVYACIGGRDLHVGLDCDEFHLVPGAVISQLTVEALQRVSQIQGHKTVYFICGIPDLLTTLSSPGYEETIFEDRNLFDTFYGQMRQTDMALKLHNCHVIFSTVSSMSIRGYNENSKKQGKTYTLRFEKNYPEMQENLHRLLKQINNTITSINTRQKLLTPSIHSYINKKSEKNKIVYRLDKLLDGLNPCGTIVDGWRNCMNRTILRNKVMMSKPDFVMKM